MNNTATDTLISILIPAYNVEKWIEQCINSVTAQTHSALQIVVVDDGSTDNTPAILDRLAAADQRIEVHHTPNGGVAAARNRLLSHIRGEYFLFVDADDWVEPDMCATLLNLVLTHHTDIAVCGMLKDDTLPKTTPSDIYIWDIDTAISKFVRHIEMNGSMCNKLVSSHLCKEDDKFDNRVSYGEDALFFWQLLQRSNGLVITEQQFYHYRTNPQSISHSYGPKRQSEDIVWHTISAETKERWPFAARDANARRCIQHIWQLYYASAAAWPRDAKIRAYQRSVRHNLWLIYRSHLAPVRYLIFGLIAALNYSTAALISRK